MIRLFPFAVGAAIAGLAASAAAIPPAPEVAVLIHAPSGGMVEDSERLLALAAPDHGGGWFRRAEPVFSVEDFQACQGFGAELETCVRRVLAERGAAELDGPPTVVVLIGPGPGFTASWTCVGVGEAPRQESSQRISVDFMRLQSEGSDPAAVQAAAGCVTYAASESGW